MPKLFNIRHERMHGVDAVAADFRADDGRIGSISVTAEEHQAHGDVVLEMEADACCAQARAHRYVPPGQDRFDELR